MHKPLPRVSIVILAYNEASRLRSCLEAIAMQSCKPWEVIVVDNNSTDDTAHIARSFSFVRVVPAARQGIVFARNAGFDAATGDVIGRIDADVVVPPDWVARIRQFYNDSAHHCSAVSGAAHYTNIPLPHMAGVLFDMSFYGHRALTGRYALWGSSMALTRSQWQAVRSHVHHRTDIHEDLDLSLHLYELGYTVVFDPGLRVEAELRRVIDDRSSLWPRLQWYPRALRLHHIRTWPICWLIGVPGMYMLALVWSVIDACLRTLRSPVLSESRND